MSILQNSKHALLVVDVQPSFSPPKDLIERAQNLAGSLKSIATVERHNEAEVPFFRQLGWKPSRNDSSLVKTNVVFIKHGYSPPRDVIDQFKAWKTERVFVCGIQAETCVLAAGFALFDAGLQPTIVADAVVGSSLDPSGQLGLSLWRHHFGQVVECHTELL